MNQSDKLHNGLQQQTVVMKCNNKPRQQTATTNSSDKLQQQTATTNCNNELQQRTEATSCNKENVTTIWSNRLQQQTEAMNYNKETVTTNWSNRLKQQTAPTNCSNELRQQTVTIHCGNKTAACLSTFKYIYRGSPFTVHWHCQYLTGYTGASIRNSVRFSDQTKSWMWAWCLQQLPTPSNTKLKQLICFLVLIQISAHQFEYKMIYSNLLLKERKYAISCLLSVKRLQEVNSCSTNSLYRLQFKTWTIFSCKFGCWAGAQWAARCSHPLSSALLPASNLTCRCK